MQSSKARTRGLDEALALKAGVPIPSDDEVVMDDNIQRLARLDELSGHVDVRLTGGRVSRRMIMGQDKEAGVVLERGAHDLTGIDRRLIDCSTRMNGLAYQPVFLVQI